ncbi:MAG: iron-sulfur cluster repair di-iron protein [Clostridia bacterium]|nr:iron-sulfur cluster repair di-iron protein [Clostridia bacterium]
MDIFKSTQSVGEIVSIMPKASEIFKRYRIDFCCGGNRLLMDVIKEQKLDEDEILKKLDEAFEENKKVRDNAKDFRVMSPSTLIEYIENTHHVYVKNALPELNELVTKIMRVHGINHDVLFRVHKLFSTLKAEIEQHLIKEEDVLFPMIRDYDKDPSKESISLIDKALNELENEHEAAGDILKELRKITVDYKVPDDGCGTYHLAFKKLEEFEGDLFQHIHLENNILFKKLGIDEIKMY